MKQNKTESTAPIGVFDSGAGGLSVLLALQKELPGERFIYFADNAYAPYGERGKAFIIERSTHITQLLQKEHSIKALVVGCNTATAIAIDHLRTDNPHLPIIGIEPAIKTAISFTKTGHIAVLATQGTLESDKFKTLSAMLTQQYPNCQIRLQACDGLAGAIERSNKIQSGILIRHYLNKIAPLGSSIGEIDTIVLGCTHYPLAKNLFQAQLKNPSIILIEPGTPVAKRTRDLLANHQQLSLNTVQPPVQLLTSGPRDSLLLATQTWLKSMILSP